MSNNNKLDEQSDAASVHAVSSLWSLVIKAWRIVEYCSRSTLSCTVFIEINSW